MEEYCGRYKLSDLHPEKGALLLVNSRFTTTKQQIYGIYQAVSKPKLVPGTTELSIDVDTGNDYPELGPGSLAVYVSDCTYHCKNRGNNISDLIYFQSTLQMVLGFQVNAANL